MEAKEYQKLAARTLIDRPDFEISDKDIMTVWTAIGLAGESGEVADLIKKGVFHRHGVNIEKIKEELGDVMWYLAGLCTVLELDLSEILKDNINKLIARYPNGYSSKDSINRNIEKEKKTLKGTSSIEVFDPEDDYDYFQDDLNYDAARERRFK